MRVVKVAGVVTAIGLWLFAAVVSVAAEEPTKSLIDGELSAWQAYHAEAETSIKDVWTVSADRVLDCRGQPLGYVYTRNAYEHVVFDFEWRWPPGTNPGRGGVLLRTKGEHKIWPKSLEVQLNAGDAGDFWGLAGYELKGPVEKMKVIEHPEFGKLTNVKKIKPLEKAAGQWNQCRIHLEGERVSVIINGELANEASGCELGSGPICLTAEGNAIQFRKIRARVLK